MCVTLNEQNENTIIHIKFQARRNGRCYACVRDDDVKQKFPQKCSACLSTATFDTATTNSSPPIAF